MDSKRANVNPVKTESTILEPVIASLPNVTLSQCAPAVPAPPNLVYKILKLPSFSNGAPEAV